MDSRNKRASAICVGLALAAIFPNPDGTIAQADRQQASYCYAGILATATVPGNIVTIEFEHLEQTIEFEHQIQAIEFEHIS